MANDSVAYLMSVFSYVLMELVETEKDYVRDLSSVVDGYIANLEKMELPADLVGKDKIIFANIAQILEFHKKSVQFFIPLLPYDPLPQMLMVLLFSSFLKEIEKCLDNYEVAGSAFVKYVSGFNPLFCCLFVCLLFICFFVPAYISQFRVIVA